jgi:NAD-dependent dihydropyrimidine dehydrogenase PreA subunit
LKSTDTWQQIVSQKITIDHDKCISCGACVEICPFMVYDFSVLKTDSKRKRKFPVPVYLEDCFLCQSCQAQCPTDAITIEW